MRYMSRADMEYIAKNLRKGEAISDEEYARLARIIKWIQEYRKNQTFEVLLTILITLIMKKIG